MTQRRSYHQVSRKVLRQKAGRRRWEGNKTDTAKRDRDRQIRDAYLGDGWPTMGALAKQFGLSLSSISRIINREMHEAGFHRKSRGRWWRST